LFTYKYGNFWKWTYLVLIKKISKFFPILPKKITISPSSIAVSTFVSTSCRSGSRIKTQHRTIVDGLISSPPWDRHVAGHPSAFNNRFYPDSLRPPGRKAGPGVFFRQQRREQRKFTATVKIRKREVRDRYLLSCNEEELSWGIQECHGQGKRVSEVRGKKTGSRDAPSWSMRFPTLALNVAKISNATYMRHEYSDNLWATPWQTSIDGFSNRLQKRRNLIIYSCEILSEIISIKYSINIKSKIILFFLIFRKVKFFVILTEHLKLFHLPLNSYYEILFSEW